MDRDLVSVDGMVVAITGGCGGIGMATARSFALRGAKVALGDLDGDAAQAAAAELGDSHIGLAVDVGDAGSFEDFLDGVEEALGPVDVLVNNAGVMLLGPLDEETEESTETTVRVNLIGVINGTKLAMVRMKARGRGRIVNIASQAGKTGFPGGATYSATKFGVVGLSEAARNELVGTGVGITCVMPGPVRTELAGGIGNAKGVRWLSPYEVGEGIARAVEMGDSEVWLPPITRWLQPPTSLLSADLRDRLMKVFGADRVLSGAVDESARSEYEGRVLR
ncbi:MAG: SDR family NAD(P)-dependent oxidoreductase [Solirubrobacterales bacterium]